MVDGGPNLLVSRYSRIHSLDSPPCNKQAIRNVYWTYTVPLQFICGRTGLIIVTARRPHGLMLKLLLILQREREDEGGSSRPSKYRRRGSLLCAAGCRQFKYDAADRQLRLVLL